MSRTTAQQAIIRFSENEQRVDTFVNTMDSYTTNTAPPRTVQSLPAFMAELQGRMLIVQYKGDWQPYTAYDLNNVVRTPDNDFIATTPHTSSGDFWADHAAGKWVVYSRTIIKEATETVTGYVYVATQAEAVAGRTDAWRGNNAAAVTPEGLSAAVRASAPVDGDTTRKGVVRLATVDETFIGTSIHLAATPAGVKNLCGTMVASVNESLGNLWGVVNSMQGSQQPSSRGRLFAYGGSTTFTAPEDGLCIGYVVGGGAPGYQAGGSAGTLGLGGRAGEIVPFSQFMHAGHQCQVVVGGQSGGSFFDGIFAAGATQSDYLGQGGSSTYGQDGAFYNSGGGIPQLAHGGQGGFYYLPARLGYTAAAGNNGNGVGAGLGYGAGGAGSIRQQPAGHGCQGVVWFWFIPITPY